ncbi:uncharacterized protein LOC101736849 isoform X2 [Bombyx mori]|uniref:C2H2-type domain-containing protein n=1 Tax=Bombyx mori TaxID=7091 RepID=A0A8R2GAI7_BOMMO|nr:uncharacterized protein LOC101736849 isoform X2 [Bombyx mori]
MRNVGAHLLEDKMDEAVTHYINTHQANETVHVTTNGLPLSVQDDGGGRVTVMHTQNYSAPMCRQVSVNDQVTEGQWGEELLDPDSRIAAIVAQLAQQSRTSHHLHHKVQQVRNDVDTSVILDGSMRLYNGQTLEQQQEPIVVHVPQLPPLPPLQEMKRCQETDWFHNKTKNVATLKDNNQILTAADSPVLELAGASPVQNKHQSKKSLPHKKRISKKLKKSNGSCTPQQDIVVISCTNEVPHEEILPDNFVTGVQHQDQMPEDTHHITHEVRPILLCQLCGEFYGEEQLKFFQHLKQHYEPHTAIIIENPVPDLGIDKMTNTCIVDNVATLPDSIVELSLENTVPKTMYQNIDKQILYTTNDKTLSYTNNKVQYSMANIEGPKDVTSTDADKSDLYDTLDKLELYSCAKCSKSFRKQKQCEAHIKEAHSNGKIDDMGEFSEPEDLMEGIHVSVEEAADQYEHTLLPHLTVDNGHVHQEHVRHWYSRGNACDESGCCGLCSTAREHDAPPLKVLKEEVLQRILETDVANEPMIPESIMPEPELPPPQSPKEPQKEDKKKTGKKYGCPHCSRVFYHRSSLFYHVLSHGGKQHACKECGKAFYTSGALKIHRRVHNGDRPYKCDVCGHDFRQWTDLKYHKVIHTNQKCFKCEFCGKEFARKYSLNVHRRIHTGERNYKCDYCTKSFRASSYRLSHMKTHTGDKPYKCEQCDKSFRVAFDLKRHVLTHEKARQRLEQQNNKSRPEKEQAKTKQDDADKRSMAAKGERKARGGRKLRRGAPNVTVADEHLKVKQEFRPEYRLREEFGEEYRAPSVLRDTTDGKVHVYTHVARDGALPDGAFFEKLTALYNVPAV